MRGVDGIFTPGCQRDGVFPQWFGMVGPSSCKRVLNERAISSNFIDISERIFRFIPAPKSVNISPFRGGLVRVSGYQRVRVAQDCGRGQAPAHPIRSYPRRIVVDFYRRGGPLEVLGASHRNNRVCSTLVCVELQLSCLAARVGERLPFHRERWCGKRPTDMEPSCAAGHNERGSGNPASEN